MLKIRKRDGTEAIFDRAKIKTAIQKANLSVSKAERLSDADIGAIAQNIEDDFLDAKTLPTVESVQDKVVMEIMRHGAYRLANNYVTYRYQHELKRKASPIDDKVTAIVDGTPIKM